MNYKIHFIFIVIWSAWIRWVVWPMIQFGSIFSDRIKNQLKFRPDVQKLSIELSARRREFDRCVVFYCSSAGEYEQARPLIERLSANGDVFCHVFFFSAGGSEFIVKRGDKVSWSLCTADSAENWGSLFAALRPQVSIIVRHELWPSFLWVASQWSKVFLIDAVPPSLFGRQSRWLDRLNLFIKNKLMMSLDGICIVHEQDREFFEQFIGVSSHKIFVTGDTKYDRVFERAIEKKSAVNSLRTRIRRNWCPEQSERLLIAGSIYREDIEMILEVLKAPELAHVKVFAVPHDVSSKNLAHIFDLIRQAGYSCEFLSDAEEMNFEFSGIAPQFIIVDQMGRLSELYGIGDFAWVGGAMHAKVHNVLEPAAWGLPISCGPKFENSTEAQVLKKNGFLFTTSNASELSDYWIAIQGKLSTIGIEVRNFAQSFSGASGLVIDAIFKHLNLN